jgi:hypothetical protein
VRFHTSTLCSNRRVYGDRCCFTAARSEAICKEQSRPNTFTYRSTEGESGYGRASNAFIIQSRFIQLLKINAFLNVERRVIRIGRNSMLVHTLRHIQYCSLETSSNNRPFDRSPSFIHAHASPRLPLAHLRL